MVITALKAQVKTPDRVSVFIDGKFHCGLSLVQVADLGLKRNQEVDAKYCDKLKKLSDLGKLQARTLEWIFRRPRSSKELSEYLFKKRVNDEEKKYITEKLSKYVDDTEFARFWIDGRRGSKNKSAKIIRLELMQKGVDREIVDDLLQQHETKDQDVLLKVIEKKRRQTKYQDEQKLKQYLVRQGFNYSDIDEALKL